MRNKKIAIIIGIALLFIVGILLLVTGRARTDVYLKDFELSADSKTMTLKIGISSSTGYVRKMKRTSGSMNYYFTFYSTFGINSKVGSKDTFEIDIDSNVDAIYFYIGDKGYKQVLQKMKDGKWVAVSDNNIKIIDKTKSIENFACDTALDKFYEDDNYEYFYSCIKGNYVVVKYSDGTEETVAEALQKGNIKITDLDIFDIDYYKQKNK